MITRKLSVGGSTRPAFLNHFFRSPRRPGPIRPPVEPSTVGEFVVQTAPPTVIALHLCTAVVAVAGIA